MFRSIPSRRDAIVASSYFLIWFLEFVFLIANDISATFALVSPESSPIDQASATLSNSCFSVIPLLATMLVGLCAPNLADQNRLEIPHSKKRVPGIACAALAMIVAFLCLQALSAPEMFAWRLGLSYLIMLLMLPGLVYQGSLAYFCLLLAYGSVANFTDH